MNYLPKAIAIFVAIAPLLSSGQLPHPPRQKIEALNKRLIAATQKRDAAAFKRALAPWVSKDFVYTEGDTTMNFNQMIGLFKLQFSQLKDIYRVAYRISWSTMQGYKASIRETITMFGTAHEGRKKAHPFREVDQCDLSFLWVNGQWKMVAMATVPLKFIIDGKSLPMGGAKHPHKG